MAAIVQTVLIITGITGFLALMLTLAKFYLATYGEVTITINDARELVVEGGGTLLSVLGGQGIFLPSACGGKGTCGLCKCKVIASGGPLLPTEAPFFTEEEQMDQMRLACQVRVKNDLKLIIPVELLTARSYEAVVEFIKDASPTAKHLRLRLSDGQKIKFKAGQYIQLTAPPYPGNPEAVFRAYSLASSPAEQEAIELIIGYKETGIVTVYVHKHLAVGDKVAFNGPFGDFYLRDSDAEIILVAAGTGIAPIRSILYQIRDEQIQRKTTLFFGARTEDDLICAGDMYEFEKTIHDFTYRPVLSRVGEDSAWQGDRGRVTDSIEKYLPDGDNKEAYLCGSPAMVQSSLAALLKKGFKEDRIFFDKF
ncbi:MAG TPA: 2Fe-2S iron-sulfur cluster binding domain-containing protein [Firmicutes bacterium]|nr:2Fe-2S iron-sulfur cluster binding domain-containing protein [Bacillota bacterium]